MPVNKPFKSNRRRMRTIRIVFYSGLGLLVPAWAAAYRWEQLAPAGAFHGGHPGGLSRRPLGALPCLRRQPLPGNASARPAAQVLSPLRVRSGVIFCRSANIGKEALYGLCPSACAYGV